MTDDGPEEDGPIEIGPDLLLPQFQFLDLVRCDEVEGGLDILMDLEPGPRGHGRRSAMIRIDRDDARRLALILLLASEGQFFAAHSLTCWKSAQDGEVDRGERLRKDLRDFAE